MRFAMNARADDVMDEVWVTVNAVEFDEFDLSESVWVPMVSTRIKGTGESDLREWVRDALVAALEVL